jgi:hypothetical protein
LSASFHRVERRRSEDVTFRHSLHHLQLSVDLDRLARGGLKRHFLIIIQKQLDLFQRFSFSAQSDWSLLNFPDKHGDQGGRLYNTAMSILVLEVYYRYLPIYGKRATAADFK